MNFCQYQILCIYWGMRGKAVNSLNMNILADLGCSPRKLSTEMTPRIRPQQITRAIFLLLEGHSPNFQRHFLDTMERNESTAETENHNVCICHIRLIPAKEPPIVSCSIWPDN